ncbi:MAG: hypothetical protein ACK4UJ_12090 [Leptonema sp. (in: bacteria)]
MKTVPKKLYYYWDLDLFGYYYIEMYLSKKNYLKKKRKLFVDSVTMILSLDKEIDKMKKYYDIIIL